MRLKEDLGLQNKLTLAAIAYGVAAFGLIHRPGAVLKCNLGIMVIDQVIHPEVKLPGRLADAVEFLYVYVA